MNYAELYERVNKFPNQDTKAIVQQYKNKIQWRKDGRDRLLDVGCGTGNPLMSYVYPIMPATFETVMGTDISMEMIKFARKTYENYKKCDFRMLDIATKELPEELCGEFDHVVSFFTLQWIHDQRTVLANIYSLLRHEGGDCLFAFLVATPIYDVYLVMHKTEKWSKYMQDIDQYISPLYYNKDPVGDYTKLLEEAGFTNCHVEVQNNIVTFDDTEHMKELVKAVCPFMERLTTELQEEFLNDFAKIAENPTDYNVTIKVVNQKISFHYKLLVVYTQKPCLEKGP